MVAILTINGDFRARHGSFDIRETRYEVGVQVTGPIINGFVTGIDSTPLMQSLSDNLARLDGKYLDDIVGRATNENIGLYVFYQMCAHQPFSVEVTGDGIRTGIQKSDTDNDRYPSRLAYEKARSLLYRGLPDKAAEFASEAIGLDGSFAQAYNLRGRCRRTKELWSDALPDFEKAAEIGTSFGEAFRNIGNALYYTGRTGEMIHAFSKAIELMPTSALAFNNRGFAYQKIGKWDMALADHMHALQIDPNYAEAYSDCASALRVLGRLVEAEELEGTAQKLRDSGEDTYSRRIFY